MSGYVRGPIGDAADPRHGTANGYNNLKCRCDRCRKAWADHMWRCGYTIAWARRNGAKPREEYLASVAAQHGNESKYKSGCRCDLCRMGAAEARRYRRANNPEARARANAKRMERYHASKRTSEAA